MVIVPKRENLVRIPCHKWMVGLVWASQWSRGIELSFACSKMDVAVSELACFKFLSVDGELSKLDVFMAYWS